MGKEMSKGRMVLFLVALFLCNVGVMGDMVLVPALGGIFETYGDQVNLVNFIASGPALIQVLSALPCGKLMQYMSKKTLLTIGVSLFAVGSILGAAVPSPVYMAAMRVIVGIAMGIINVSAMALIAETFIDEKKRSTMMGAFNSSMAGIGAIIGFVAGFFATTSWQSVFKVYWIAVPVLVMVILFIPKTVPEGKQEGEGDVASKKESVPLLRFGAMSISLFVFNAVYMVIIYQISVFVAEKGMGNESVAGTLNALGTIGSCLACMMFGVTYSKLKRASILPSYVIMSLGFLVLLTTKNVFVAGVACTLMGSAYGNGFSYFFMRSTVIVPPSKTSVAISLTTAIGGVGGFASTYMVTALKGAMGVETVIGIFPVLVGLLAVGSILSVVFTIRERKNPVEYKPLEA